jgi:hypothetical protein
MAKRKATPPGRPPASPPVAGASSIANEAKAVARNISKKNSDESLAQKVTPPGELKIQRHPKQSSLPQDPSEIDTIVIDNEGNLSPKKGDKPA